MTREERAREALLKAVAPSEDGWIECRPDWIIDHMLAFADAEAAAMRERAAEIVIEEGPQNPEQDWTEHAHTRAFMRDAIVKRIRALPATGEVGRG